MLNVEMDDGWNSDEVEEEKEVEEKEVEEKEEEEPKVPLSKKERQKLYHLKVGETEKSEA